MQFYVSAKNFPMQISQQVQIGNKFAAWLDFCVSWASWVTTLLTIDNGIFLFVKFSNNLQ